MQPADINVLLVEDHLAVRKGIELVLRAEGFHVIGQAQSASEGLRLFKARRPHVAIVDLGLGDGDGSELAAEILALDPAAGVLMYTGVTDREQLERAAQSGARGFALKTGSAEDLVTAVCSVARGGDYVDPAVAATLAPRATSAARLSRREREILDCLSQGMTGEDVAKRLFLSPETVRTHIRNAMRKLDANTRVHAVALAVRLQEIDL
jgi:DNA-binding NarL/FixJ family response regulator